MSQRSVVRKARDQLAHYNKEKEIDESRGPAECADLFIDAYVNQLNRSIKHNARCVSELSIGLGYVGGACVKKCDDSAFRNMTAMNIRNKLEYRYGTRVKYEGSTQVSEDQYFLGEECGNGMEFSIDISLEPKK